MARLHGMTHPHDVGPVLLNAAHELTWSGDFRNCCAGSTDLVCHKFLGGGRGALSD
jgi:hypothetical protein